MGFDEMEIPLPLWPRDTVESGLRGEFNAGDA